MYSILSLLNFRLISYNPSSLCFIRQFHSNKIKKVLIANRGEIAVRVRIFKRISIFSFIQVMRTAKMMGIEVSFFLALLNS